MISHSGALLSPATRDLSASALKESAAVSTVGVVTLSSVARDGADVQLLIVEATIAAASRYGGRRRRLTGLLTLTADMVTR